MMEQFKALMVDKNENDFSVQVKNITLNEGSQTASDKIRSQKGNRKFNVDGINDFGDSRYYYSPLHSKVRR
jgi:translation elongation factor EF-4